MACTVHGKLKISLYTQYMYMYPYAHAYTFIHVYIHKLTESTYKSSLTGALVFLLGLLVGACGQLFMANASCSKAVPLVMPLATYGLIVPLDVTLTVMLVHSCFGVYKA